MSESGKGVGGNSTPNPHPGNLNLDNDLETHSTNGGHSQKRPLSYSDGSTPPSQGPGKNIDVTDSQTCKKFESFWEQELCVEILLRARDCQFQDHWFELEAKF